MGIISLQHFIPIYLARGLADITDAVIELAPWEITRAQAETYDAYQALLDYAAAQDPALDWANIPGTDPSISTAAWTVPTDFLGYLADDTAGTGALATDSVTHVGVQNSDLSDSTHAYIGEFDTDANADASQTTAADFTSADITDSDFLSATDTYIGDFSSDTDADAQGTVTDLDIQYAGSTGTYRWTYDAVLLDRFSIISPPADVVTLLNSLVAGHTISVTDDADNTHTHTFSALVSDTTVGGETRYSIQVSPNITLEPGNLTASATYTLTFSQPLTTGAVYYNLTDDEYRRHDGTSWVSRTIEELFGTHTFIESSDDNQDILDYFATNTYDPTVVYFYIDEGGNGEPSKITGYTAAVNNLASGMIYFNTTDSELNYYDGTSWGSGMVLTDIVSGASWTVETDSSEFAEAGEMIRSLPAGPNIRRYWEVSKTATGDVNASGLETLTAGNTVRLSKDADNYIMGNILEFVSVDASDWTTLGTWNYRTSISGASGDIYYDEDDYRFIVNPTDNAGTNKTSVFNTGNYYNEVRITTTDATAQEFTFKTDLWETSGGGNFRISPPGFGSPDPLASLSDDTEIQIEFRNPYAFYELNLVNAATQTGTIADGDTLAIQSQTTYNFSTLFGGTFLSQQTEADIITHFGTNTYNSNTTYYYYDGTELRKITALVLASDNGTYYDTTNDNFRKTTDGGTNWADAEITDALLTNNANAAFLTQQTSVAARTHLDTEGNYDSTKTYFFYNGTVIREVTNFTPTGPETVRIENYELHANAPSELSFTEAVIGGTLPLTSRIGSVLFNADVLNANTRFQIPVTLTAIALTDAWSFTAGTVATRSLESLLQTTGSNISNLALASGTDSRFTVSGYGITADIHADFTSAPSTLNLTATVDGESIGIVVSLSISQAPQLGTPTLSYTAGISTLAWSWTATGGAESYNYRSRESGGTWSDWVSTTDTSVTLTGLSPSTSYEFEIQAAAATTFKTSETGSGTATTASDQLTTTWAFTQGDYATLDVASLFEALGTPTDYALGAGTPAQLALMGSTVSEYTGGGISEVDFTSDDFQYAGVFNLTPIRGPYQAIPGSTQWPAATPNYRGESGTGSLSNPQWGDVAYASNIDAFRCTTPQPPDYDTVDWGTDIALSTAMLVPQGSGPSEWLNQKTKQEVVESFTPTIPASYTEVDVGGSDLTGEANNGWGGETSDKSVGTINAYYIYYDRVAEEFWQPELAQGGGYSILTLTPATGLGSDAVWLGHQSASEVLTYFDSNTYDFDTSRYFYYDTDLTQVRKITSYTAAGTGASTYNSDNTYFYYDTDLGQVRRITALIDAGVPTETTFTVTATVDGVPVTLTVTLTITAAAGFTSSSMFAENVVSIENEVLSIGSKSLLIK